MQLVPARPLPGAALQSFAMKDDFLRKLDDAVIVGRSLSRSFQEKITATAKDKRLPVIVLHIASNDHPIVSADANLCDIDGAALIVEVLRK